MKRNLKIEEYISHLEGVLLLSLQHVAQRTINDHEEPFEQPSIDYFLEDIRMKAVVIELLRQSISNE